MPFRTFYLHQEDFWFGGNCFFSLVGNLSPKFKSIMKPGWRRDSESFAPLLPLFFLSCLGNQLGEWFLSNQASQAQATQGTQHLPYNVPSPQLFSCKLVLQPREIRVTQSLQGPAPWSVQNQVTMRAGVDSTLSLTHLVPYPPWSLGELTPTEVFRDF